MRVPKKWYVFDDLPVDKNGSVDDDQLRMALITQNRDVGVSVDEKIQLIISKVLHLSMTSMSLSASFIQLGGDSITAIEVISRCQLEGIDLKVRDLMRCESLAQLSSLSLTSSSPLETIGKTEAEPADNSITTRIIQSWGASEELMTSEQRDISKFTISTKLADQLRNACDSSLRVTPGEVCLAALQQSFQQTFTNHRSLAIAFFSTQPSNNGLVFNEEQLSTVMDFPMAVRRAKDFVRHGQTPTPKMLFTELSVTFDAEDSLSVFLNNMDDDDKNHNTQSNEYGNGYYDMNRQDHSKRLSNGEMNTYIAGQLSGIKSLFHVRFSLLLEGGLFVQFDYPKKLAQRDKFLRWVSECRVTLENEIPRLARRTPFYSLSDFPCLPLEYSELDRFVNSINKFSYDTIDKVYPTSSVQDGILLALLQSPKLYRIDYILEIRSSNSRKPIDLRILEKAWGNVVAYHRTLRTIFVSSAREGAMFDQIVLKEIKPQVRRLNTVRDSGAAIEALRTLQEASFADDTPAHLFTICDTNDGHVHCRLEISHAIMDGMSGGILFEDTCKAYLGCLPMLPVSDFSNYIGYLQSRPKSLSLKYWAGFLNDIQPCHFPILVDQAPPSREIKNIPIDLDNNGLREFCMGHNITGAMLIQAVWGIVLRGYTLSNDVSFGFLSSGRDMPIAGVESMIGPLINLLICRINFDGLTSFEELFSNLRNQLNAAMDNQDISLAEIQHEVVPGKRQIFNTLLSILYSGSEIATSENEVRINGFINYAPTDYDITLYVSIMEDDITMSIDYFTSLLSEAQAQSLASAFKGVLNALLNTSSKMLDEIIVLSELDRTRITEDHDLFPAPKSCSHWQIQQQIESNPSAPAVSSWDRDLTYSKLGFFASRLAWRLKQLGAGPGVMIPLCFPKSAWVIVSMVAVNMAGAAFVPLDPTAPLKRLQGILEDSGAMMVLSAPVYAEKLSEINIDVFVIDEARLSRLQPPPPTGVFSSTGPDDPSFMIFTSGSTGRPKGMVHTHSGISATARAYGGALLVEPGTRVFQFSAYTFDIGILDVLVTLMRGACICVPSDHERVNDLAGAINLTKANWVFLTPSVADLLNPVEVPTLKRLILGGEAVPKKIVDRFKSSMHVVGIYGPAEASNCAHNPDISASHKSTNIGRPIGSAFWVVNPSNRRELLPIGCIGELLIQGPMLARGYLNVHADAAANFLDRVVFVPDNGFGYNRAYLTGDLVRRNQDGTFNYIGRKDTQVKLHGQRIELGEIETHLNEFMPQDMGIIVDVLSPKSTDRKVLTAFLWYTEGPNFMDTPIRLVECLSTEMSKIITYLNSSISITLPPYMIPSVWLIFRGKPEHTVSGKVSRRHLIEFGRTIPADDIARFSLTMVKTEPPTTEMEYKLRDLWAIVLHLAPTEIGKHDAFLQIGGDSIAAIRLVSLAKKDGITLTIADIFEDSRLSHMAVIAVAGIEGESYEVAPFSLLANGDIDSIKSTVKAQCCLSNQQEIEDVYPCTSLQAGLIALSLKQPGSYMAKYSYRIAENIDLALFQKAWEQTVELCDSLRTRIVASDGNSYQAVIKSIPDWEPTDGLSLNAVLESPSMNSSMGYGSRLCRYALVNENIERRFFVLTIHHSIFDGWGLNLILETLNNVYHGKDLQKLKPTSSFINHSSLIDHDEASAYWTSQLRDAQRAAFPKMDSNTINNVTTSVMRTKIPFQKQPNSSFTTATILRAAWAVVIARYCDTDDICFGTTVSGRQTSLPGIERMTGPSLATVPIRIILDKEKSVSSFLEKVQSQASKMSAYEQFGLQNISKLSSDARTACDFASLMVIQPVQILDDLNDSVFMNDSVERFSENALEGYFTYPLVLQALMHEDYVELLFTYNPEIVIKAQLEALSHHFDHTVQKLLTQQDSTLGTIDIAGQWDQIKAVEFNSEVPEIVDDCIHRLIESRAKIHPNAIAIDGWDGILTYSELDIAANRLAHQLINDAKVQVGDIVHVLFEKSIWFAVTILAINKAGAAWVPMDPSHPTFRLQQIVQQTRAKVAVTSMTAADLGESLVSHVIKISPALIEQLTSRSRTWSTRPPIVNVASSDAAYVLFTSGTTGVPKGVVIEHRSVCTSQVAISKRLGITPKARLLQFSAYVFDALVGEMIGGLVSGACVCVPSEHERLNGLKEFMNKMKVSCAWLTPTFARTIKPEDVPSLRLLLLIGEAVTRDVFELWFDKVRLVNAWGPAETCVLSATHEWQSLSQSSYIIGKPVGGFGYIVNPENPHQLAPIGCIGEIVIQGPTLLREYLSDPAQTGIATVSPVPDWALKQTSPYFNRFYKTGDLGFFHMDGSIEYIGRKDAQIKIRGLRIELGDVEQHIRDALLGVKQVAVDVLKSDIGSNLIAYFSFSDDKRTGIVAAEDVLAPLTPEMQELVTNMIGQLNVSLPRYMIPTTFIPCSYLPVITSTKLDRKGLRNLTESLDHSTLAKYALVSGKKIGPQTPTESRLQNIWAKVLRIPVESIGRDDSFMGLGGDSITAIQVTTALRDQGMLISVNDIFVDPRLSAIAARALETENAPDYTAQPFTLLSPNKMNSVQNTILKTCHISDTNEIEDAYPCTSLQEGLIALAVKQPGSYIAKNAYLLPKNIDSSRFKTSWEQTLQICPILRTRIIMKDGVATQVVLHEKPEWEFTDNLTLSSFLDRAKDIEMQYGSRLCRYAYISDDCTGDSHFVLIIHHTVFDGWSLNIILGILAGIYKGQDIPNLQPYSSFINYTIQVDQNSTREYWKKQLDGAQRATFARVSISLDNKPATSVMKSSISFPRRDDNFITKATILRAAWVLILSQYCDTEDVCFGTTVSGRQASVSGVDRIAGPTLATIPIRVRLNSKQTVSSFLDQLQKQATEMVQHEQFGLRNISRLGPDAQEACDFSSLLIIQPIQNTRVSIDDILVVDDKDQAVEEALEGYFTYPLVLQALIYEEHIELLFTYNAEVICKAQLEALSHHFEHAVQELLTKPQVSLSSVSIVSDWDLVKARQYNPETPEVVRDCVHHLIESRARRQPNSIAIDGWDGALTYAELDAAANRLAYHLVHDIMVQVGDLVHVLFEKSIWFVVSILAVNKAGAAWVPMDPSHPIKRLQQITQQTHSLVGLTSVENAMKCATLLPTVVQVSASFDKDLAASIGLRAAPRRYVTPDDPCYVLFTSGSTGMPKGLVMSHGSVCTSQTAIAKRLGITPTVRMLQFSAHVFDLCVGEVVAPLISGATVCIPSEDSRITGLTEYINDRNVTWAILTSTFARTLKPEDLPGLELLILSGEAVHHDVFRTWFGKLRLVGGWGPAETCVLSTIHEWTSIDDSSTNVGRPVGGYCWIVNPKDPSQLAPIGCIGEIVVQGPTLLTEYLDDAIKTATSTMTSLPNWAPLQNSPHWKRIFKTGDLCYYNPDGTIQFVSRKDTQVKIRGLRVELGEVEHHLHEALEGVSQVAVDVFTANTNGTHLIAYFCFNDDTRVLSDPVEAHTESIFAPITPQLKNKIVAAISELSIAIPRYMVPTLLLPCRFMPSVTSGKLDRRSLRLLTSSLTWETLSSYSMMTDDRRAPETTMEIRLQSIWANILHVSKDSIGRDDSFFRIGGDSISVIQFVTTARESGLVITVKDVFDDPRLLAVAAQMVVGDHETPQSEPYSLLPTGSIVAIKQAIQEQCGTMRDEDIEDAYPCTGLQEGLMALSIKQPGTYIAKNIYRVSENIDMSRLRSAWEQTVEICNNLRTRIIAMEGATYQTVLRQQIIWESTQGHDLSSYLETSQSIIMVHGSPLARYALITEPSGANYFIIMAHHAIFDGWSLNICLTTLYNIYHNTSVPAIHPYNDFIRYIDQIDHEKATEYWKYQLQGAQRATFPRAEATIEAKQQSRLMKSKIFLPEIKDSPITKATIIRSAWALTLAQYCDSDDVCFGATVSGRHASVVGIERMAGPAVATVPIRVRLDRKQNISDFLQDMQKQASDMVPFEQFGLRNISKLGPEVSEACEFSSLLVVQPVQHEFTNVDNTLLISVSENYEDDTLRGYFSYPLVAQGFIYDRHFELLLIYNPALIPAQQVHALSHHFDNAIKHLLTKQDAQLTTISLASEWDLTKAIQYNSDEPKIIHTTIHQLIESQATRNPYFTAIQSWDATLTYSDLDSAANRLATYLVNDMGVHVGDFIHLCFEKSIWFYVSMLAVNKAGAAWVPLEPTHPIQRQRQIVSQTRARLCLSSMQNFSICSDLVPSTIEVSSELDQELIENYGRNPKLEIHGITPEHAAYVLFTSGSTGTPKGLVMQHQAVSTSQTAIADRLGLDSHVKILQFASYVFDLCIGEMIAPLISGASLCVPSEGARLNSLQEFVKEMKINWAFLTPSFARTFKPEHMPTLELLLLTGEAVGRDVFDNWVGRVRLITGWGPAETCVFSTLHEWNSEKESPQTVGRPVGGHCWIVDPQDPSRLAPIGCIGEVMIQGPTLLQEYLADPDRTTAATITTLPSWVPKAKSSNWSRFFKSGDICRYNHDGTIEFVSRKDTQAKIRGLRIELGEIEHHLRIALPGVQQVVVEMIQQDTAASLAAFFCFSDDACVPNTMIDASDILLAITPEFKDNIASAVGRISINLPSYMVPTLFFPCRAMPYITSTKLDRGRLKRLAMALDKKSLAMYALADGKKRAPQTSMEFRLRELWATILELDVDSIGRDDSFLRIGGDSITAIQFVTLARELGLTVTVRDIFADPRLSVIATKVMEDEGTTYAAQPFTLLQNADTTAVESKIRHDCDLTSELDIEDIHPCSSLQEGLMALAVKQPGSYIARYSYTLLSSVNIDRFKSAWEQTLEVCGNLRSRIILHNEVTVQAIIREPASWEITNGLNLDSFMEDLKSVRMHYGSKLCRYAIVTQPDGRRHFLLVLHHAVFDGWSLNVIFDVLSQFYQAESISYPEPYSTFINYTTKIDNVAAAQFWSDQLDGAQRASFPQIDISGDTEKAVRVRKHKVPFPKMTDTSITKASLLRAAWAIVMARYSETDDIVFGTIVSGRHAPVTNIYRITGPTVATVPIRVHLHKEKPVSDLLQEIQKLATDIIQYEQYGLHNIAKLSVDAKDACNFASLMTIQPVQHVRPGTLGDSILRPDDADAYGLRDNYLTYPLGLEALTYENEVEFVFTYDSSQLSDLQLEALSHHLEYTLFQLSEAGDAPLRQITITGKWDFQQLSNFGIMKPTKLLSDCVHLLVSRQALRNPSHEAIYTTTRCLTYKEVDKVSTQIAMYLTEIGVRPEMIVPICIEKSIWAIISQLAIMKTGGAFLPLDPSHPMSRRQAIINEVGAEYIIVSSNTAEAFSGLGKNIISISDALVATLPKSPYRIQKFKPATNPKGTAYLFFTSGSTGKPKGVVTEHAAVCSCIIGHGSRYGLGPRSRVLQFSNYAFDGSISEIYLTLIYGGTVCIPSEYERMNGIPKFINEADVTLFQASPSFARTINPADVPSVNTVVLGGEALAKDNIDSWFGRVKLINGYGPTEATVLCCLHAYQSDKERATTIGRGTNARCLIVDASNHAQLAPFGCVGELVIEGPALARGYFNDVKKTEAAFIEGVNLVPFVSAARTPRFYKTGDLAKYNFDGTIEYIGRKDTQVKIRGLRIELGEVEYQVGMSIEGIKQVVVDVLKSDGGSNLVAYYTLSDSIDASAEIFLPLNSQIEKQMLEIRGYLNSVLPRYMVPNILIPCSYLPSSNYSKLDRKALRTLALSLDRESLSRYALVSGKKQTVETRNEAQLQKLWSQVLDIPVDGIGRDDSFMGLGGDSITAIQLVAIARDQGITLTVSDIFADPRLSSIAATMTYSEEEDSYQVNAFSMLTQDEISVLKPKIQVDCHLSSESLVEDIYPCSSLQEGLMALTVKQSGSYIAKSAYILSQNTDLNRFRAAWEKTVELCGNFRTRIVTHNGKSFQVVINEKASWDSIENLTARTFIDTFKTSDIKYASRLCRYAITREDDGQHHFILVMHHAIFDGWSLNVAFGILNSIYQDEPVQKMQPYSSFINYVTQIDQAAAAEYWKNQLEGSQHATFPRIEKTSNSAPINCTMKATIPFSKPRDTSITQATILRAAWAMLLARYSDTDDICFGTTVSGRHAPVAGVETMVGPAVATIPIRIRLEGQQMVSTYLKKVQQESAEMVKYEQFGLRNISNVSQEAKEACNFSSLLVIQPVQSVISANNNGTSTLAPTQIADQTADAYFNYPLVLMGLAYEDRIELDFTYHSNVITETQLQALSHHLENLVYQLCQGAETTIGSIAMSGSLDLKNSIEWNDGDVEVIDSCIHSLIEKQAHLHPHRPAVSAWDGELTYQQLNEAANQFAHFLINDYSVKTGEMIQVCFEKSIWYTVAIVGINKAGAAWVPIDPTHPTVRHQQVIQQTCARIAVTSPLNSNICENLVPHVIQLSPSLNEKLAARSKEWYIKAPNTEVTPSDIAYVLFTSGTTGVPKGVVMEHRSVCTSQVSISRRLNITPNVRLLQFSAHVFDVSVGEIIGALISGACVCIPSDHDRMNGLKGFINMMNINWAYLTPTFANTLNPQDVPCLELLLLAGEAVRRDIFETWFGKVRLFNGWGPAETCVLSAIHEWTSIRQSPLTIGKPVGGFGWIVSPEDHTQLAPIGCVGEIVIQGPTVLREYLSNEAQTQNAVVSSLPSWIPRRSVTHWNRFYKTGDLCLYNMDGTIQYIGRKDTQIKIRGLRVELGEVEQKIRQALPEAKQVAVDVVKSHTGSNLVAYLSFNDGKRLTKSTKENIFLPLTSKTQNQIAGAIGQLNISLPRYMVPTIFVPCEFLPIVTSGKLDRKRLKALTESVDPSTLTQYSLVSSKKQAPKTSTEEKVQQIWSKVFQIPADSIGRDDSFIGLGGDSITAIQFVTIIPDQGMSITVNDVFADPRLSAIATKILDTEPVPEYIAKPYSLLPNDQVQTTKAIITETCHISNEQNVEDAYPCTSLQEGLISLSAKQPGSYIAKYVYRLPENINLDHFKSSWDRTTQICAILRTRIIAQNGIAMQTVLRENAEWEPTDGLSIAEFLDNARRIEMGYGSRLSRYALITEEKTGDLFFSLIIHHAVFDGWSLNLILGTLTKIYKGSLLPELHPYSSFINYTMQINQPAAEAYWLKQLNGAQRASFPPVNNSLDYKPNSKVMKSSIPFPKLLDTSITKATILRAAWALVLARYCYSTDVCFGTTISGRQAPIANIDHMAGPTVTTVPVRIRLDNRKSIPRFLKDIQKQALEMVPFEQFGLQNISNLSVKAKEACDFSSLMVIQPMQVASESSEGPDGVLLRADSESYNAEEAMEGYFTYPLVLQCLMFEDKVELFIVYDSGVLNETQVRSVVKHLTDATQQLQKEAKSTRKPLKHKSSSRALASKKMNP